MILFAIMFLAFGLWITYSGMEYFAREYSPRIGRSTVWGFAIWDTLCSLFFTFIGLAGVHLFVYQETDSIAGHEANIFLLAVILMSIAGFAGYRKGKWW